jgi:hypothetical protein
MKNILIIAVLVVAFLQCSGQEIQVENFKRKDIFTVDGGVKLSIGQYIKGEDTVYFVAYVDQHPVSKGSELDLLTIDELKRLADALVLLTDDRYKVDESTVTVTEKITVRKVKISGTKYWINNMRGFTYINARQVRKLKEAVYKFFNYPE